LTLKDGVEHGAIVDGSSGVQVGPIVDGEPNQVDLAEPLSLLEPGKRYAQIHPHPGSSSFSRDDGLMLTDHALLFWTIVVGADGTWYILSKPPGLPSPASTQLAIAHAVEANRARAQYLALAISGALTREEWRRQESHEIWRRVASLTGLRYDRLEQHT
jgi:hypothetical protein